MKAFRLAFALMRIPRLFLSLLMGPLFIGLIIVSLQVFMLSAYTRQVTRSSENFRSETRREASGSGIRYVLYGKIDALPPLKVCRWNSEDSPPPHCLVDDYDVMLRVDDPASFDSSDYEKLFAGATKALHLCRECANASSVVINVRDGSIETHIRSVFAILVVLLAKESDRRLSDLVAQVWEHREMVGNLLGTKIIHLPGTPKSVIESTMGNDIVVIMNVVILVVLALWLALRSHRKVLDYFAQNGALLPLVAANGKKSFYSAIWLITMSRVLLFLGTSVPITCIFIADMMKTEGVGTSLELSLPQFLIWLLGLIISLAVLTLLGSIAELKHRRPMHYLVFKYVPLLISILGGSIWVISLAFPGEMLSYARSMIAVIPISGLFPLILSPLFLFNENIIAWHIIIATLIIVILMYTNARWFAAHLEEL